MKVLIVGSGGREHALGWKLSKSPRVSKLFFAPGNAGTAALGENVALSIDDLDGVAAFSRREEIGLVVVGPDNALALGMCDVLAAAGIRSFGPGRVAAQFESSKIFAKAFMTRHGIPTARSEAFSSSVDAHAAARSWKYPLVVKADGLALGKGVTIAHNPADAAFAIHRAMDRAAFGSAGSRIVLEEFLEGRECSVHALVSGTSFVVFPDCRDHKHAFDGNQGPNTGGMGTVSPAPGVTDVERERIVDEVIRPFVAGAQAEGIDFRGMLFPGIMMTVDGPKVLEFNCRFGDPETQVLMRRLESDLLDLLDATVDGRLDAVEPQWSANPSVCVVLASGGYPGSYRSGLPMDGLTVAGSQPGVEVFHAGTRAEGGRYLTAGGRVVGVTASAPSVDEARERAYQAAACIHFENRMMRTDIGRI